MCVCGGGGGGQCYKWLVHNWWRKISLVLTCLRIKPGTSVCNANTLSCRYKSWLAPQGSTSVQYTYTGYTLWHLFSVTCQKNIGRVGTIFLLFSFLYIIPLKLDFSSIWAVHKKQCVCCTLTYPLLTPYPNFFLALLVNKTFFAPFKYVTYLKSPATRTHHPILSWNTGIFL